ncbi:MAG: aspartate 1-decarboxylase [Alphaproteobacteria bacterium]|nr:aspartate 1-decarboxylase [Alphaproteobacteria bacterium]
MQLTLLKGKLHRATVTGTELGYEGSITIDPALLEAANILPYEQVDVLNVNNGARFTTYTILSKKRGSGEVTVNGAAARLTQKGDIVIVCAFCQMPAADAKKHKPAVVMVDAKNKVRK